MSVAGYRRMGFPLGLPNDAGRAVAVNISIVVITYGLTPRAYPYSFPWDPSRPPGPLQLCCSSRALLLPVASVAALVAPASLVLGQR